MSNFKKLVEARIEKTGESWSTAAHHVRSQGAVAGAVPRLIVFTQRRSFDLPERIGELDARGYERDDDEARLGLTAMQQLVRLLGAGFRERAFDLVCEDEMLLLCRIQKMGTSVRPARNGGGEVSGGCTLRFDRVCGAVMNVNDAIDEGEVQSLANALTLHSPNDLRMAQHSLDKHPLRGPERSRALYGSHGTVTDGQPLPGVRIYPHGNEYRVRITEVSGTLWSYDELSMSPASLRGYGPAMLDRLGVRKAS